MAAMRAANLSLDGAGDFFFPAPLLVITRLTN